jgi:hypothetical protein
VKYINQFNTLLAVLGFAVFVYALAGTFLTPSPDPGRIELPRVQTAAPMQRPVVRPPAPTAPSRVAAPVETGPVAGQEETPAGSNQAVPQALFPPTQPPGAMIPPTEGGLSQEAPRSITIQGQTGRPSTVQQARPRPDQQQRTSPQYFPQRQVDRPLPPPQDPNAVKRQPGDGTTPPPVRSSMPEQNPPR